MKEDIQSNKRIKFIYFDFGNVLAKAQGNYFENMSKELDIEIGEFKLIFQNIKKNLPNLLKYKLSNLRTIEDMDECYSEIEKRLAQTCNSSSAEDNIQEKLKSHRYERYTLIKGVRRSLQEISKFYKIGLLSNAFPSRRSKELVYLNLSHFFETIIISSEEGVEKPNPEIFEIAKERSHLQADEIAFVDDNFDNLTSALNAGFQMTFLVDTGEQAATRRAYSNKIHRISHIQEILTILE